MHEQVHSGRETFSGFLLGFGRTAADAFEDVGLNFPESGHGAEFEPGAVLEHQHHVSPGTEAPGHGAHLADL